MVQANIGKDLSGRIVVSFPYDPSIITKIKTIEGRRWHPAEKHWSFPNSKRTLEKNLEVFDGERIHLDPVLKVVLPSAKTTTPVIARHEVPKQSRKDHPDLTLLKYNFEDLRREFVSRKYSYTPHFCTSAGCITKKEGGSNLQNSFIKEDVNNGR